MSLKIRKLEQQSGNKPKKTSSLGAFQPVHLPQ